MRPDELDRTLTELHAQPTRGVLPGRADLEGELLARHDTLYSRGRGSLMKTLMRRPVAALLLIAAMGIAACTVPTETSIEMGHRLAYTSEDGAALTASIPELTRYLDTLPGIDSVSVGVEEIEGGETTVEVILFGAGLDRAELEGFLARRWPALAAARLDAESFEGSVRTSLAQKLGHELFHFDFAVEGTPEEMQAQILEQIRASGFDGDAVVEVSSENGQTTFQIEMSAEDGGFETQDEIIIEMKDDDAADGD